MGVVLDILGRLAALPCSHGTGKWLLTIPLICLFGRLRVCTAMSTGPAGRWSGRMCALMFFLLSALSFAVAAVGAVSLYAWVHPGTGFPESIKKLEQAFFSSLASRDLATNGLVRSLGNLMMIGIVSVWGACAVWAAQSGLVRVRQFWSEIPHRGGKFLGEPVIQLLEDGRRIRLLEDYSFQDPRGRIWTAPAGSVGDGGSIPRFFWRSFGPPLVGHYRNASIIHDFFCQVRTTRPSEVHRMFYEACLAEGLSPRKARIAYWAVIRFGPHWGTEERLAYGIRMPSGVRRSPATSPLPDNAQSAMPTQRAA